MKAALRLLIALLVVSAALLAALASCGGNACFRNSDCISGYACLEGICKYVAPAWSDGGDADSTPDAGDQSQIPDGS